MVTFSWGQSIFENPITGTNPNTANPYTIGQIVNPNITVSGIGRGVGITGTNANDRYNANSWNTASIDLTQYFEFTLTPNVGYKINFVNFTYTGQASDTGPINFAFRSSVDGYSNNVGTPNAGGTTINLSAGSYQNITTPITFRFYGWGASGTTGTFSINDFIFNGIVLSACTPAVLSSVTPASGPVGTEVTITASSGNLTGATVTFSGINATIISSSTTQIVAIVPSGASTGVLSVNDTQPCTADSFFTVINNDNISCEGTTSSDLILYEIHDEQTGTGGTITIFNGTATIRNLSNYKLYRTTTHDDGNEIDYATLTGSIAPGTLAIIKVSPTSCGPASTNGNISGGFNEDDGIQLRNGTGTTVIDDVDTYPTSSGYYMIRNTGALTPRASYVASDWNTIPLGAGVCASGLALSTPSSGIKSPPSITTQPTVAITCSSSSATLSVTASEGFTGGNALAYQWYVVAPNTATWNALTNGGVYSGATSNTLSISSLAGLNNYQYYCQVRENDALCYKATIAVKITDFSTTWNGTIWSNGSPDLTKLAIVNGNYNTTPNGDFECCSLVVNSGFTLNIQANNFILIENNLTVNGTFNVLDDGSLVQVNNGGINTGNISYERITSGNSLDYVYWSSPISNQTLGTSNYFYFWNPVVANTNGGLGNWINASGSGMATGVGYIMRDVFNRTFTLGIPNNGIINVPISRGGYTGANYSGTNGVTITNLDDNLNLIGNPYPSALNSVIFLTANTNIEGAVRIWTHGTSPSNAIPNPFYGSYQNNYNINDYIIYNGTGTTSGPTGFNGNIASGQGFFVIMNDGSASTQNVVFNNSMRNKTYDNSQFYRTNSFNNELGEDKSRIWLEFNTSNQSSKTLVGYIEGATMSKDRLYDAVSLESSSSNIYSLVDSKKMVIQGRFPFSDTDQVVLGVKITQDGNHSIGIAAVDGIFENQNIYLEDLYLNSTHDLKVSPYHFNANKGVYNDRFLLKYKENTLSNDVVNFDLNQVSIMSDNGIEINSKNNTITSVTIYDVLGRKVFANKLVNSKSIKINTIIPTKSTLIVKIILENSTILTKKIIY